MQEIQHRPSTTVVEWGWKVHTAWFLSLEKCCSLHWEYYKNCVLGSRRTLYFHPLHLQPTWKTRPGGYLSVVVRKNWLLFYCNFELSINLKKELPIISHRVVQLLMYFISYQARGSGQRSWLITEPRAALHLGVVRILRYQNFVIFYTPPPLVIKRNHGSIPQFFQKLITYIT